jgi:mannose-6-phosphate isomerase-like protein (cupin superfamily)
VARPSGADAMSASVVRYDPPPPVPLFFLRHYVAREPAVIRIGDWSRLDWKTSRWSNEYLVRKAGNHDVRVLVRRTVGGRHDLESTDYVTMMFRDFVRDVLARPTGNDAYYLNLQHDRVLDPPLLQLLGDFTIPPYFQDVRLRCVVAWMGRSPVPIVTPLHHDFEDNLYAVVEGRKRFLLYPPSAARSLYTRGEIVAIEPHGRIVYAPGEPMPHLSRLDPETADPERFPLFGPVRPYGREVTLAEGDLLFVPAFWFHRVVSEGEGRHIALSFFAHCPPPEGLRYLAERLGAVRVEGN